GAHDDALLAERELRRVEEEDLAEPRVERIDAERPEDAVLGVLWDRELELDAVGATEQSQQLCEVFVGKGLDHRCLRSVGWSDDGIGVQAGARRPIPAGMDDSFSFGKPARRQVAIRSPRVRAPRAEGSGGRSGTGRIALLVLGGIVVVVVVVGFMTFVKGGGE